MGFSLILCIVFCAGYRMVKPYVYEFRTHAKERWYERELLAVFIKEFGANSPEYYVRVPATIV